MPILRFLDLKFLLFASTASAAVLHPLQTTNLTTSFTDSYTDLNDVRPLCNARQFGSGLNIRACAEALRTIFPSSTMMTFGMRDDGHEYLVLLPYWWVSVDAVCTIELYLIAPYTEAHATIRQVHDAAVSVYNKCAVEPDARGAPAKGGIATQIGGDNHLAVAMKQHSFPRVVCGSVPGWDLTDSNIRKMFLACDPIREEMPASQGRKLFGPSGTAGIDEELPLVYSGDEDDYECQLLIESDGHVETATYYEIWEQLQGLLATCTTRGMRGTSTGIGSNGNIKVNVQYRFSPSDKAPANNTTIFTTSGNSTVAPTADN